MFAGWAVPATARSAGRVDVGASWMFCQTLKLLKLWSVGRFELRPTPCGSDFPYTEMPARPRSDFPYTKNSARPRCDFTYTKNSARRRSDFTYPKNSAQPRSDFIYTKNLLRKIVKNQCCMSKIFRAARANLLRIS